MRPSRLVCGVKMMRNDDDRIAALIDRLSHSAYGGCGRHQLQPAQWTALRFFSIANSYSRTASAFARYQGTTPGAASQTIRVLVERELLTRTPDPADGRKHRLALTPAARALLRADPIGALARGAETLNETERETLTRCLEKVLDVVVRDKGAVPFGRCATCRFLCRDGTTSSASVARCRYLDTTLDEQEIDSLCVNFSAAD